VGRLNELADVDVVQLDQLQAVNAYQRRRDVQILVENAAQRSPNITVERDHQREASRDRARQRPGHTVGKRTPLVIRMSNVAGELGSADTVRDPRGFAIKFYTEEGNYDMVGNNMPVFSIRVDSQFSDFIHSLKRMPGDDLCIINAQCVFCSLTPQSANPLTPSPIYI